jgi:hypothetical protein
MGKVEIFCPKCGWIPSADDRWACVPECGNKWNTFSTRGVCLRCGKQWKVTQCLSCREFSPHEDWYHYPEEESREDQRVEETEEIA